MPNPSPGLLNAVKKTWSDQIWALKSTYKKSDFVSLKKLKSMDLRDVELRIGAPDSFGYARKTEDDGKAVLCRSFTGRSIRRSMFSAKIDNLVSLCGIGHEETGTWMIDVTDEVVDLLNKQGACSISKHHCSFEQVSPKVKRCKYCDRKLVKRIVIKKSEKWEEQ